MTNSPLQVLAEYCGFEVVRSAGGVFFSVYDGRHILSSDDLFCRALDKLAAEGWETELRQYNRKHWLKIERVDNSGFRPFCESHRTSAADTRIEALAKLVEKVK